ncbi:MAG: efflux RND transporter periplasmic adaptor subunit [Pyrinomonadaceae bacterium]|nr:efflux RND transporter periplasmic adaptor subunit [Pyrinomonadaceae bacterium]
MNRADKIFFGVLFLSGGLLAGCSRTLAPDGRASTNSTANARPIVVHVYDAQPSPASAGGELLIPAALSVADTAIVLAEREGRLITLRVQEGARVTKGEALAQFNNDDQASQLRQAEIEVTRLKVEEQQYEALVKLNKSELDRELLLNKDGVSSRSDVERAQYKLDQSTHEYEKTRLATESARARVAAVKLEVEKSVVRAPITGIITRRHVALGTNVARNDKLFEVSKLAPLEIKFQLPQTEKEKISIGQIINLSAANSDRMIATARIRRIDPVADATSNTLGYLADITGGSGLMPGLAVNVHLPFPANSLAFWIPRAAFPPQQDLRNGASSTLLVVDGARVSNRTVLIGAVEGDQVEINSGLTSGERVILLPPAELKSGDVVEISPG